MNSKTFFALAALTCCSARSFAQVTTDRELHDTDAPVAEPSPPPLVIDDGTPAPEPTAAEAPTPVPPAPGAAKPVVLEAPREEAGRGFRIGMSLLFGAGAGSALAVAGGLIGGASPANPKLQPLGNVWAGASVGFAVGAPLGVLLAGWLFGGHGAWWAVALADLVGFGLGALSVVFGGTAGTPLLFALPLGGSVLGWEVTASSSPE